MTRQHAPGRVRLPASVRLLAAVWLASATADQFLVFVLFWIAEGQGWSAGQTALVVLLSRLPTLVGGPIGGRVVDRLGSVPVIIADAATRCTACVVLVVDGARGGLSLPIVLAAVAVGGLTTPAGYAAVRSLVPRLVPDHQLPAANALIAVGDQLPLLLGAALVGPSLTLLGVAGTFAIPAVLLAVAGVLAMVISPRRAARSAGGTGDAQRPRRTRLPVTVYALIGLSTAYYAAYGPFETVLPLFVRDRLGGGAGDYGVLWMAFGIGAIATIGLAPRLSRTRPAAWNALGALAWGLATMPLLLTSAMGPAIAVFCLSGAVWGPYSAIETTAIQRLTPRAEHGRVFGTQRALLQTAAPVGAAVGILATGAWSPTAILLTSTIGCALAGAVTLAVPGVLRPGRAVKPPRARAASTP
jgi:predicted MFS family arabinose efflux permease